MGKITEKKNWRAKRADGKEGEGNGRRSLHRGACSQAKLSENNGEL